MFYAILWKRVLHFRDFNRVFREIRCKISTMLSNRPGIETKHMVGTASRLLLFESVLYCFVMKVRVEIFIRFVL